MFENLSERLTQTFKNLKGQGKISEKNVEDAIRDVRMSFLEADVNFRVVKEFIQLVKEKALGEEVLKSLSPGQQFIKIIFEELVKILGDHHEGIDFNTKPPVVAMVVGLQGSGKTTSIAKLANLLKEDEKKKVLLVPCDVYRPAAIDQLTKLASQVDCDIFPATTDDHPVVISMKAKVKAELEGYDAVLIDTAGRLQIDDELMGELEQMKRALSPQEILFVADAMTGQDAVTVATEFDRRLDISGVILTKMDGDARGGAALSIKAVTGKPLKYVGVGEKIDGIELFHPDRIAQRILGMGDILTLVEKAQKKIEQEDAEKMQKKMLKGNFTLEDFLKQMQMMKKMGSMSSMLGMLPGLGKLARQLEEGKEGEQVEKELKRIEAMVLSMTVKERKNHAILNGSRRRRIAKGSGTSVQELNRFIKQFLEMRKMMKNLRKGGMKKLFRQLGMNPKDMFLPPR